MIKAIALGTILLVNSYVVEPIEITVGIGNCQYVYIEEKAGLKCDVTINCNKAEVKNNKVEVYIILPKEAQNVKEDRSKEQN